MLSRRSRHWLGGSIIGCVAASLGPVQASDYSNECKSADGAYVADDGVLYRAADKDRKHRLTYAILSEQVLEEKRSHCIPSNPEAQGGKFDNFFRKARQQIEIDEADGLRTATLVCELAASGLPAAFDCAREVVTMDRKRPGPAQSYVPGAAGTWSHNGSVMRLEADGSSRRLIYMNPRIGIRQAGVSADTTLFDGERQGNRYVGNARFFSKSCGAKLFPVTGTVSADESRIVLEGAAPRLDGACKETGTRTETLVFERAK